MSRHVATQFPGAGSWPWNVYECGPQALVHVRRVPYPIALMLALALTLRTTFFDRRNPRLANSSDTLRATFSIWVHPDGLFSTRNQPIGVRENSPTFTIVPPLFFLYSNLMVGQMSSHWGVVLISILFKIFSSSIWFISHHTLSWYRVVIFLLLFFHDDSFSSQSLINLNEIAFEYFRNFIIFFRISKD